MIFTYDDRIKIRHKIQNFKCFENKTECIIKKKVILLKIITILDDNNIPYSNTDRGIIFDLIPIKDEIIDRILDVFPKRRKRKDKDYMTIKQEKFIVSLM